jgi:hypothetical protein
VIVALLKKYKISDHPRKFALYERYQDDDNGKGLNDDKSS